MPVKSSKTVPTAQRPRGFFKTLASSIYGPEFYAGIPKGRTFGQAFGYFLLATLLFAFLITALLVLAFFTKVDFNLGTLTQSVQDLYPVELIVTVENGQVYTNVHEPYFIALPEGWKKLTEGERQNETPIDFLLVIDTQTPFSITQLKEYRSFVWLTKDSFYYVDPSDGTVEGTVLDPSAQGEVTKEQYDQLIEEMASTVKTFIPLIPVLMWLGIFLGATVLNMIYLLFLALLILIIGNILRREIGYGESYKVGLYAMTIVYATQLILTVLNLWTPLHGFKFLVTIVAVVMVGVNFKSSKD